MLTIDQNIFVIGMKILSIMFLGIFLFISFVSLIQTKNINESIKTKLSGLINFLVLLRIIFIILAIILVIIT